MFRGHSNGAMAAQLLLVTILWGGNNVAVKYQVQFWPPVFTASSRFLCAGLVLVGAMRWFGWFGSPAVLTDVQRRHLWTRTGLTLALYIGVYVWALTLTSASTVALFMGTSPVWALVWEERFSRQSAHRYAAALLALAGVAVLFLPSLTFGSRAWLGDALGLGASLLWTIFSRQCRSFSGVMSGLELTGQNFWRAGLLLMPVALLEMQFRGVAWDTRAFALQGYTIFLSGLLAFALWNRALRVWPTSRAFLFANLTPLTTMLLARFFIGEPITSQFWLALGLVVSAVLLGQADWRRIISARWSPGD